MNQHYNKDQQNQTGKNVPADKTKLDHASETIKTDQKKSDQTEANTDKPQDGRHDGTKLPEQADKKTGSDKR